ncbi:MAG: META domain-containing protein [Ignavibacteriaceae bacterium]|nr:META domain-containing protein [Ignavibacteriaceae bacterium]
MKESILFFLTLITIIYGCSTKEVEGFNMNRLHDIWALESIAGEKIIIDENVKNLPVLEIYVKEERVHGNTSCNTIDGKVEIDKNNVTFSDIITTEMACPGDIEPRFLSALSKVNNYKIEKLKLYLYEDDREIMIFQKID